MLLIFCLNLRKDQLLGKPGNYFLARGRVRLGCAQGPNASKDSTDYNTIAIEIQHIRQGDDDDDVKEEDRSPSALSPSRLLRSTFD